MRVSRRRVIVAGLLLLAIVAFVCTVAYLTSPREPTYEGKTLTEWITPFCRQTAKGLDAPGGPEHFEELEPTRRAVRQIGTNAIPFLIARLNRRESGLRRAVRQFSEMQPFVAFRLANPYVFKIRAIRALAILGAAAQPATASLAAQLADTTISEHAVYALSGMGTEGMRTLVEQYTNLPVGTRIQIALTIISPASIYRGENVVQGSTNQVASAVLIDGLLSIAEDRTINFRTAAIQRLGDWGPLASNAVPFLMQTLTNQVSVARCASLKALGQIGSRPEVVVPALTNLLSDPDPGTRMNPNPCSWN